MITGNYAEAIIRYRKQNKIFSLCAVFGGGMLLATAMQPRLTDHLLQVNLFWAVVTLSLALLVSGPMIVAHNRKVIRLLYTMSNQGLEEN